MTERIYTVRPGIGNRMGEFVWEYCLSGKETEGVKEYDRERERERERTREREI